MVGILSCSLLSYPQLPSSTIPVVQVCSEVFSHITRSPVNNIAWGGPLSTSDVRFITVSAITYKFNADVAKNGVTLVLKLIYVISLKLLILS